MNSGGKECLSLSRNLKKNCKKIDQQFSQSGIPGRNGGIHMDTQELLRKYQALPNGNLLNMAAFILRERGKEKSGDKILFEKSDVDTVIRYLTVLQEREKAQPEDSDFVLLKELAETYGKMEHIPGILSKEETKLIEETLEIPGRSAISLRNLRDITVLAWSKDLDKSGRRNLNRMDEVSAITAIIDGWLTLSESEV